MTLFHLFFLLLCLSVPSSGTITAPSSVSSSPSPRVAICFFGLTRSLQYTRYNLYAHILDLLKQHEISYDIYVHTYDLVTVSNARSKEENVTLDANEWKLLYPYRHLIDNEEQIEKTVVEHFLPIFLSAHGDPYHEKPPHKTMRNTIKQFYSLQRVTELWTETIDRQIQDYQAVLYLRPDLWYFNDLNVAHLQIAMGAALSASSNASFSSPSPSHFIYIPNFHSWGGANDRFAFGPPHVMKVYGSRLIGAANYSQIKPVHPETYLSDLLHSHHIVTRATNLLFERVRANGVLWGIPINGTIPPHAPMTYQLVKNVLGEWSAVPTSGQGKKDQLPCRRRS
jgi:hypothetical protein